MINTPTQVWVAPLPDGTALPLIDAIGIDVNIWNWLDENGDPLNHNTIDNDERVIDAVVDEFRQHMSR